MKRFFLLFVFLLTLSTVGAGQGTGPLTVTDNTRTCNNCRKIVFSTITVSGNTATVSGGGGGSGDVVGPASATDNAVARFNLTTGKLIQNSVVTIGDTGNTTGIANLTFTGVLTGGSAPTTITDSAGKILSAALNTVQPAQGGTGITALDTGIATALGVNIGSAGAPVLVNGAGGTPSSLTLTNGTGLPISTGVSGLGTGVAAWLATPSSANLAAALTDETGSGLAVFATSPTLTTPVLGVATATSINKVALTVPATSATLTIADGKTLTASNTLTFTGTDASSVAFGAGGTVAYTSNNLSAFAATTSAQLAGVLSDETGSGLAVFGTSPTLTTPTISGAISFPDDVRQTFNPGTTNAGLNVGSLAGDPSTPSNGDLWYDSTANELTARINGANVALGAGGGGGGITVGTTTITSGTNTRVLFNNAGVVGEYSVTGTGNAVLSASPTLSGTVAMAAQTNSGTITQTSASATAFVSGLNGATTPAFVIDNSTASQASGLKVIGKADGTAPEIAAISRTQITTALAGNGLAITADPAIAGSSVAGAAAGGNMTITAGNAARLTSGNANGGSVILVDGAGIGTGVRGGFNFGGTASTDVKLIKFSNAYSAPSLSLQTGAGADSLGAFHSGTASYGAAGATSALEIAIVGASGGRITLGGGTVGFASASATGISTLDGNRDTGIQRKAAGVLRITGASDTGAGSLVIGSSTVGSIGTSGVGVLAIANGTAPTSRPADQYQNFSKDYAAGDARMFVLSESGALATVIGNNAVGTEPNNGTDQAGAQIRVFGGQGTGNATPGQVRLAASARGASGTTVQTLNDRAVYGGSTTLTDATATSLFTITLPTLTGAGGTINFSAIAADATDVQVRNAILRWSTVNKAGTYTNEIVVVSEAASVSAGTLTCTFDFSNGSDQTTIRANCDTSLTATSFRAHWDVVNSSPQAIQ